MFDIIVHDFEGELVDEFNNKTIEELNKILINATDSGLLLSIIASDFKPDLDRFWNEYDYYTKG